MANYTIDPVTGILIPIPGLETGPVYATEISNALAKLSHLTHTGAANSDGYQIPAAGLNIDNDLSIQSHNITALRSAAFTSQGSVLSGIGDVNCVYFKSGNLYINNGSGTPVQVTGGSSVVSTASQNYSYKAISGNLTISAGDGYTFISADSSGSPIIITLPIAATVPAGRVYIIKDNKGTAASNNITINPSGSDKLDTALTTYVINAAHVTVGFVSDGISNWQVLYYDKSIYKTGDAVSFTGSSTLSLSDTATLGLGSGTTLNSVSATINSDSGSSVNLRGITHVYGRLGLECDRTVDVDYTCANVGPTVIAVATDTTAVTVNLPAGSSVTGGTIIIIKDYWGSANTHNITVKPNGSDLIDGSNSPRIINTAYGVLRLCRLSSLSNIWMIL